MSLVGNLEDLGLGDITQIVSLSRKSGVLLIERGSSKAKIIFRDGQVLAAFTSADRQDPAARLVARGILDERAASEARARHRASEGAEPIQECLVAVGASPEAVQEAARAEIERAVLDLFGWEDGDFSFDLKDVDEDLAKVRAHPHRVIYEAGLNPQFLLMEASRIVDEAKRAPRENAVPRPATVDSGIDRVDSGDAGAARRERRPPDVPREAAVDSGNARADSGDEKRAVSVAPSPGPAATTKLIVADDDDRFLRRIAPVLESWGYAVECFPGGGPAADRVERLVPEGGPIVVLSDLLMPRVDGGGLLGGIELLERVRRRFASLPFVLLADHLQEEAESRARLLDVDFTLAKPRSAVLAGGPESPAWREFLGVLRPILESLHRPPPPPEVPRVARADSENDVPSPEIRRRAAVDSKNDRADSENDVPSPEIRRRAAVDSKNDRADSENDVPSPEIRRRAAVDSKNDRADSENDVPSPEIRRRAAVDSKNDRADGEAEGTIDLRRALGGISDPDLFADGDRAPDRTTTPGLAILKSMLCELTNPETGAEITLLMLRFAAEIMNRAVLFMVKNGEAIGLGGFGLGPGVLRDEASSARRSSVARGAALRRIRIPLDVPSVFHDVVGKRSVVRGRLESSPGNDRLQALLGRGKPAEVFVAPITVGDEVVALLYGDNLPEERPVGDTEALEIFLTQAGLALEKAILERRLSETGQG